MDQHTKSFQVYGFTIEVHAGGRRVWPPSFKRFIKQKLDSGELKVGDVMKKCRVSQSLIYKWRSDVRCASNRKTEIREERLFSEVVIDEDGPLHSDAELADQIILRNSDVEISLPVGYPVRDLIQVVGALGARE